MQAKESLPMSSFGAGAGGQGTTKCVDELLFAVGRDGVIVAKLSSMPKKVNVVVGPSVFSALRGAFTLAQSEAMILILLWHS